jgi:hypothetical protein
LAEHWQTMPAAFEPAGLPIDLEKSNFHTAPASHEITGRVCYHGEVWIDPKFRNMRIAATLATFAQLLAVTRFMPDYNYGFIPPHLVKRGYPARIGYLHLHPWAPSWHVCGREEPYDDYLVWVTGQELIELWTTDERDADILGIVGKDNNSRPAVMQDVSRH